MRTEAGRQIDGAVRHDVIDVIAVFCDGWKWIATTVAISLAIGVLASYFLIKPSYTSTAVILPPPLPESITSTLLGRASMEKHSKMAADTCVGILNSQTIRDRIIRNFHLQSVWKLKTLADTRTALRSEVQIEATEFDSIEIIVRDHDAGLASNLANAYVNELNTVDADLALAEASQRREFLDEEAKLEKTTLQEAEGRLKITEQQTGMISPGRQIYESTEAIQRLHSEINNRTVALQAMRTYATEANPQVIGLEAEIRDLQRQLNGLQNKSSSQVPGDIQIPAGQAAETALQYQRALRDVTLDYAVSKSLISQLEAARIDQARSAPLVPKIDPATIADNKSGPQRLYLWASSCWVGFTAACLCIFVKQALLQAAQDTRQSGQLRKLREALSFPMHLRRNTIEPHFD